MTTPKASAEETLCSEILMEAQRQADQLTVAAENDARETVAKARIEAQTARDQALAQAQVQADRRRELILATVPIEAGRIRSARVESLLESVHQEVARRLRTREGFDYRAAVTALAVEAARHIGGDRLELGLSEHDTQELGEELADQIRRSLGKPHLEIAITCEPEFPGGGVVVRDAEGRRVWNNHLPARLRRLWPELRRQIALHAGLVTTDSPTTRLP